VSDVDTDGDGTPDCNDLCPADPAKTEAGVCGCGVSDVDTDGDGTPDCNDLCPADPGKTDPGICGCGVADSDTNGNGTVDCLEQGADLSIAFKSAPQEGQAGKAIAYTLKVSNGGPDSATSPTTSFSCSGGSYDVVKVSKGCTATISTSPEVTCSRGSLSTGKSDQNAIRIVPRTAGILTCMATVSSSTPDPDLSNQSVTVATLVH
jgi:hypothetical protein